MIKLAIINHCLELHTTVLTFQSYLPFLIHVSIHFQSVDDEDDKAKEREASAQQSVASAKAGAQRSAKPTKQMVKSVSLLLVLWFE